MASAQGGPTSRQAKVEWGSVSALVSRTARSCSAPGLGDLEESDQLEPLHPLGTRLVPVHFWQPCIDVWVGRDEPIVVREPELLTHRVHRCDYGGVHQTPVTQLPDV